MSTVKFNNSLAPEDRMVVSQKSLDIIRNAADASKNPDVTITSTLRPPARQAKAMYDNLVMGKRIAYAAPGREVVAVYDQLSRMGKSRTDIVVAMKNKISELAQRGQRVSKHCVTEQQYAICNVIDITTHIPNPRDFAKALAQDPSVAKVITPFASDYGTLKVSFDPSEPAIHVEINQF